MLDIHNLCQFSRDHCIAICAFLVPANMIATLQTMIFTGLYRPRWQSVGSAIAAITYALVIGWHVLTWFMIGVIMAPTFILLFLSVVCLTINFWSLAHPASLAHLLRWLYQAGKNIWDGFSYKRMSEKSASL
jgi:hypothetical protein